MTLLTVWMLAMCRQISLKNRMVIQASFNQGHTGGMVRLVRNVILLTLGIENKLKGISEHTDPTRSG